MSLKYRFEGLIERSRPKGVKPDVRERKLRRSVNWQGSLKKKGVKQMGRKQGLGSITGQFCGICGVQRGSETGFSPST